MRVDKTQVQPVDRLARMAPVRFEGRNIKCSRRLLKDKGYITTVNFEIPDDVRADLEAAHDRHLVFLAIDAEAVELLDGRFEQIVVALEGAADELFSASLDRGAPVAQAASEPDDLYVERATPEQPARGKAKPAKGAWGQFWRYLTLAGFFNHPCLRAFTNIFCPDLINHGDDQDSAGRAAIRAFFKVATTTAVSPDQLRDLARERGWDATLIVLVNQAETKVKDRAEA